MTRVTLVTGVMALGSAVAAGVVLAFAMLAPDDGARWVACSVALALAMIGGAYGPDWLEAWQRRRRARVAAGTGR
ncbi:hypothetical protein [Kitasatospora sp. CB02891]|uniref:hypothetical protein n=1 Tax=Kitasatospora sp. CB02891 TaxID=2020329 RepID=UPI000C273404|nr:hypothetical protein [Kitasatospora sp. CB02891]PJN26168.1 hypothetical protein CG736_12345 [Kitasatospora sp. CB02891]